MASQEVVRRVFEPDGSAVQDCPLFRIPAELRNTIYEMALSREDPIRIGTIDGTQSVTKPTNELPQTCKAIYNECSTMLYAINTFEFLHDFDLKTYKIHSTGEAQTRFAQFCNTIGKFAASDLRDIIVDMDSPIAECWEVPAKYMNSASEALCNIHDLLWELSSNAMAVQLRVQLPQQSFPSNVGPQRMDFAKPRATYRKIMELHYQRYPRPKPSTPRLPPAGKFARRSTGVKRPLYAIEKFCLHMLDHREAREGRKDAMTEQETDADSESSEESGSGGESESEEANELDEDGVSSEEEESSEEDEVDEEEDEDEEGED